MYSNIQNQNVIFVRIFRSRISREILSYLTFIGNILRFFARWRNFITKYKSYFMYKLQYRLPWHDIGRHQDFPTIECLRKGISIQLDLITSLMRNTFALYTGWHFALKQTTHSHYAPYRRYGLCIREYGEDEKKSNPAEKMVCRSASLAADAVDA